MGYCLGAGVERMRQRPATLVSVLELGTSASPSLEGFFRSRSFWEGGYGSRMLVLKEMGTILI